ncbi:MAG TPA: hypothetical protein VGA94_02855 [Thermodesulfobacteriota bacterium]
MDIIVPIALILSTFLALNMGANNSAASMATAYGTEARPKKETVALICGIAVSLAQTITSGIINFPCANQGFSVTAQNKHVLRIAFFWLVVPFFAAAIGYGLSSLYFK